MRSCNITSFKYWRYDAVCVQRKKITVMSMYKNRNDDARSLLYTNHQVLMEMTQLLRAVYSNLCCFLKSPYYGFLVWCGI